MASIPDRDSTSRTRQIALFDSGRRVDDEPRDVRARRLNRERQWRWRRRHQQQVVPIIESPTGEAFAVTCAPQVESAEPAFVATARAQAVSETLSLKNGDEHTTYFQSRKG